ncbi:MAG: hypothetical protein WBG02_11445 [Candidatus Acidiferrum sp.]
MIEEPKTRQPVTVWSAVITDVHFWVPVIVLIGGLVVLHWIL